MLMRHYRLTPAVSIALLGLLASGVFAGQVAPPNKVVGLLERGERVFGSFVSDRSPDGAGRMARDPQIDFAFYDAQRRFDPAAVGQFIDALRVVPNPPAILVRIAPMVDGAEDARARIGQLVRAGADGVIMPHVGNREEIRQVVAWIREAGGSLWPADPNGSFLLYVMIEDSEAVGLASEIIGTPGVGIASVGRGSLLSSLAGDGDALQAAIQTVVDACGQHDVPCSALSTVDDVEKKLAQGFRLIIGDAAVITVGRTATGGR